MTPTQERVQRWFRAKRNGLLEEARTADGHSGLIGGHRESLVRTLLAEVLPQRLSVDRGLIYNSFERSSECDVVIWDGWNYPQMPMMDHSSFFAESVLCVVEVKSRFSGAEFANAMEAAARLRRITISSPGPRLSLAHEVEMLQAEVAGLRSGRHFEGMTLVLPRAAYGVVFLQGGESATLASLFDDLGGEVHSSAPDFVTFLECGKFVRKFVPSTDELADGESPHLFMYEVGEDVLMETVSELLRVIGMRSPGSDGLHDLGAYSGHYGFLKPTEELSFGLENFPHGYSRFFGDDETLAGGQLDEEQ